MMVGVNRRQSLRNDKAERDGDRREDHDSFAKPAFRVRKARHAKATIYDRS
jgi:hypothetical protein